MFTHILKYSRNSLLTNSKLFTFCNKKQTKQTTNVQLTPKDFSLIDLRIGQIIECWKHAQSQNLYCEKIKILKQPETIVQIASGLQKYVSLENMRGKVMVMANLKARKLVGFQSQGMVVCVTSQDKSKCEIIVPQGQIGQRIYLENHKQIFIQSNKILSTLNAKKKILEKSLEHFRTDQQGYVIWKGIKLRTKNGFLKTNIKNGQVY